MGENRYKGAYSLVALIGLILIGLGYTRMDYQAEDVQTRVEANSPVFGQPSIPHAMISSLYACGTSLLDH